jgi:hypothetical protein
MMPEARRTPEDQGTSTAAEAARDLRLYVAGQTPQVSAGFRQSEADLRGASRR